ncbi:MULTISPECIES: alpha/beta fold hydrolase [Dyella]|uniref:Alpha/beta hydrolase n=2 Tax=Dyella TaxID=231454 RepID=A0A4R0YKS3_9GAMM|nr:MULTISPECIES: alpha/beta hydrolase [Dyella]TBR36242.1 alpha/beta hydrolase [Dyella terrae]TCI05899.1 alpha/beta hydrolase [Dyella soli]
MTVPRELRVEVPGLTLAAQVWGEDSLPPMLALHGWLDNAGSHALLAPQLASRFRVVALEFPGHGHSDHLPAGMSYHFPDYVRFVLAALDALGIDRFTLLGHSMGAGVGALLAAAAPQRVERFFAVEGLGPLGDDGSLTLKRFREGLAVAPNNKSLRVFRDIEQAVTARVMASGLRADLARPIVERGLLEVADGWSWRSDPRLTRTSPLRIAEAQIRAILAGIEAPTHMLLAEPATPYLPSAQMAERAACVASIEVTQMAGGHHLHMEHAEAVAAWVLATAG